MVRTVTKWTLEDYHRMIEMGLFAERQVELLDGNIIDMTPESPIHRATYRRGMKYLESLLGDSAVVFSASPITLPNNSEPQPDLCIAIPPESRYDRKHPEPEDIYWLIEVSNSTLGFDLDQKARLYAQAGIQEYWVIDLPNTQLWVHREPESGKYQSVSKFSSGTISPVRFPNLGVLVNRMMA